MWPFTKKIEEPKIDWVQQYIDEFKAFRDIGETFNYLGRTCVVTGHFTVDFFCYGGSRMPGLTFNYADDLGVIHSMVASIRELPGLIKQ